MFKVAFKNLYCLIGLTNSDNLLIFKLRNFKVDLKDHFVNDREKSNALKFLNCGALNDMKLGV